MKNLILVTLMALLAGCASAPMVDTSYIAQSQSSRVKFIVLHYTVSDAPASIKTLTGNEVSSHYLVTDAEKPKVYALVDETRQANHAGVSSWKSYTQLNASSIGIEIVNPGYQDTPAGRLWFPYPQTQIDQVIALVKQISARHNVPFGNILGHNEVAPQRKVDPGPMFPWKQFADAGLIPWPDTYRVADQRLVYERQMPDVAWIQGKLAEFGYAVPRTGILDDATRNVVAAFQMKYRPARFDGVPDPETLAMLEVMITPGTALAHPVYPQADPGHAPASTVPQPNFMFDGKPVFLSVPPGAPSSDNSAAPARSNLPPLPPPLPPSPNRVLTPLPMQPRMPATPAPLPPASMPDTPTDEAPIMRAPVAQ